MHAVVEAYTHTHKHMTVPNKHLTDSNTQEVAKFNHFPFPNDIYMTHRLRLCENIKAALESVWS